MPYLIALIRIAILIILVLSVFYITPHHALAVESEKDINIPASEPSEDEPSPASDNIIPENTKEIKDNNSKKNGVAETPLDDEAQPKPNILVLQGLNKVIGQVSTLEVPLGVLVRFENLEIIARKCWKSSPDQRPENASLLEIREIKAGEEPKQIFLGWMFSSSPSLSGLEHPVYDVTVLSCEYQKDLEVN